MSVFEHIPLRKPINRRHTYCHLLTFLEGALPDTTALSRSPPRSPTLTYVHTAQQSTAHIVCPRYAQARPIFILDSPANILRRIARPQLSDGTISSLSTARQPSPSKPGHCRKIGSWWTILGLTVASWLDMLTHFCIFIGRHIVCVHCVCTFNESSLP